MGSIAEILANAAKLAPAQLVASLASACMDANDNRLDDESLNRLMDELLTVAPDVEPAVLAVIATGLSPDDHHRQVELAFEIASGLPASRQSEFLAELPDRLRTDVERLLAPGHSDTPNLLRRHHSPALAGDERNPPGPEFKITRGTRVAQYEVERLLGRGGMGVVYRARDIKLRRPVALKFLQVGDREASRRFVQEARDTAQCRHENIVTIYDVDEYRGYPYMALEYLEGTTLRAHIGERAPIAHNEVAKLITPVARALECAHEQGIVHRDLKPDNIFITKANGIKVLDFGIAKKLDDEGSRVRTERGHIVGTVRYMSPEQWRGSDIDHRTDLWAVGVILYEMLAGKHPLEDCSQLELATRLTDFDSPMPDIGDAVADLGGLRSVVNRCLRKRKSERFGSATDLLAALQGKPSIAVDPLCETVGADDARAQLAPDSSLDGMPRVPGRPRLGALVALAGLLVAIAVVIAATIGTRSGPEIPTLAEVEGGIALAVLVPASPADTESFTALCDELKDRAPQLVRCIEWPRRVARERLARNAEESGFSLMIWHERDQTVRITSTHPADKSIMTRVPPVQAASVESRRQLAGLAVALGRVAAGDLRSAESVMPEVAPDIVHWRMAVFTWYLRALFGTVHALDPSQIGTVARRCIRDAESREAAFSDWHCALASYLFALRCASCADAKEGLEGVATLGPESLRDAALVALYRGECPDDPHPAIAALTSLDQAWHPDDCSRIGLVGVAACILANHPDARTPKLERLASPDRLSHCPAVLRAIAHGERGMWNAVAGRWQVAADDFWRAWTLDGRNASDLLNWAEAMLHQPLEPGAKARDRVELIGERLVPELVDSRYRVHAAFLRWLATRTRDDAAMLYRLYAELPKNAIGAADEGHTLAQIACPTPEQQSAPCRVYSVLRAPKHEDSEPALRSLLLARGQ